MGRSYLSVKLAFAFGVCVAVLVLVAQVLVIPAQAAPAAAEIPLEGPESADGSADGVEVCLWRGCPTLLIPRVDPGSVAAAKEGRASRPG
jgi:hypothetical protein